VSEIEQIADFHDKEKMWRTTCRFMGDDHLTFSVCTDDEHPEVYLEMYSDCHTDFDVWDTPKWSRPFRKFWNRVCAATKLLFTGHLEVNQAFLFRGESHMDALCDTIQKEKHRMIALQKIRYPNNKEVTNE
jgi:hypothetical protein